jgi:hypothetical protein
VRGQEDLAQRRSNERLLFFRRDYSDAVWRRYEISEEEFLAAAKAFESHEVPGLPRDHASGAGE